MKRIRQPRHRHVLATPLVDVLSVSINRRADQPHTSPRLEIYGHIRVIDTRLSGNTKAVSLFQKDENNPEFTYLGEPLLLNPSSLSIPSEYTRLDVLLLDRNARNAVVAKGEFVLDKTSDKFEEELVEEVFGDEDETGTFASVQYRVLQYGVAATVGVLFFSEEVWRESCVIGKGKKVWRESCVRVKK